MIRRTVAMMTAFAVFISLLPMLSEGYTANAGTYWKRFRARSRGETSVTLTWSKLSRSQQRRISGIAVYRDGKFRKRISKYAKSFTDTRLKAGSRHTYQLKTYKRYSRTVRLYYNKNTGKWQTKRIWGARSKRVRKYKYRYSHTSARSVVRTDTPYDPGDGDDSGDGDDPVNGDDPTTGDDPGDQPTTDPKMVQITDYKGNTITVEEGSAQYNDPRYNRNIDGSFSEGSKNFIQKGGVTFLFRRDPSGIVYTAYNGDASKMSLEHSKMNEEETYKAWNHGVDIYNNENAYAAMHNPTYEMVKYIRGDRGRRLADVITTQESKSNYDRIKITFIEYGIDTGSVTMTAKYDGEVIDTAVINFGTDLGNDGLDAVSRWQYGIAKEAVAFFENGNEISNSLQQSEFQRLKVAEGEYYAHMKAIMVYVYAKYQYAEINCIVGAQILTLYSELDYDEYGHMIRPYFDAETDPNNGHTAFRPDSYCDKGWFGRYFDTNGHH